jgi:hypothetical protein
LEDPGLDVPYANISFLGVPEPDSLLLILLALIIET